MRRPWRTTCVMTRPLSRVDVSRGCGRGRAAGRKSGAPEFPPPFPPMLLVACSSLKSSDRPRVVFKARRNAGRHQPALLGWNRQPSRAFVRRDLVCPAAAVTTREVEAGLLTPSLSFTPRSPPGSPRMTGWVREALDAFQVRTAEPVHPVRLSRPRAPTSSTLDAVNAIAVHVLAAAGMSRAGATLGLWGP